VPAVEVRKPHFNDLAAARIDRRSVLRGLGAAPLLSLPGCVSGGAFPAGPRAPRFESIPPTQADRITVPPGYSARVLISWGDPLFHTAKGAFDPDRMTRAEQELRFGTNNDMLALFPRRFSYPEPDSARQAILCANNEHFETALTFPGLPSRQSFGPDHVAANYASLGVSIVQIEQTAGNRWQPVVDRSPGTGFNRRITPFTPMLFGGPAARHRWIRQAGEIVARHEPPGDTPGAIACGTLVNCAGGKTPWGTYLTCEEGFPFYFARSDENAPALKQAQSDPAWSADSRSYSYPLPPARLQPLAPPQFDLSHNPMGPSLYGWVVEIDPYDPTSVPRKRTALGRRWNEGSTTALARDGRVAVYCGDDTPNQFIYKFVTARPFNPDNRRANFGLLDEGILHVARFEADGSGHWLPLTWESVSSAARVASYQPAFPDFADVLMRTREAARLLGATPMDRPEDIEPLIDSSWTGLGPVLINCTGNAAPKAPTPGNPRRGGAAEQANFAGHIIRIDEAGGDSAATRFRWNVFALCGDPAATNPVHRSPIGRDVHVSTKLDGRPTFTGSPFTSPDNICFDRAANAWITTNGMAALMGGTNDSVVVLPLSGEAPRLARTFMIGPVGCEICGPTFSFDERTFFAAIQHPGSDDINAVGYGEQRWSAGRRPPSTWPNGGDAWPLPSVVYITKDDGGIIGSG
jgi:secreted PhoX family phosphatase